MQQWMSETRRTMHAHTRESAMSRPALATTAYSRILLRGFTVMEHVWLGFIRFALPRATVLCWVDRCVGSWVLQGLFCLLRVAHSRSNGTIVPLLCNANVNVNNLHLHLHI